MTKDAGESVDQTARETNVPEISPHNLPAVVFSKDPEKALEEMERLVKAIASRCKGPKYLVETDKMSYPKVEWWTTTGGSLSLFPVIEWTRKLERVGECVWEARASIRLNGQVITAAEMMCSDKEMLYSKEQQRWVKRWDPEKAEFAIRSMSETRAVGKAFRIGFSMLAVMAGLEPTGAEEMPGEKSAGNQDESKPEIVWSEATRQQAVGFGKHHDVRWSEVPFEYVAWAEKFAQTTGLRVFAKAEMDYREAKHKGEKSDQDGDKEWPHDYSRENKLHLLKERYSKMVPKGKYNAWLKQKIGSQGPEDLNDSDLTKLINDLAEDFSLKRK